MEVEEKLLCAWSHNLNSIKAMFDLTAEELSSKILHCASASSSFNAQMHSRNPKVVSIDPLYASEPHKIEECFTEMNEALIKKVERYNLAYHWDEISSLEVFKKMQKEASKEFFKDLPKGLKEKRYRGEALPTLQMEDYSFDLALCSNFIFDGSRGHSLDFQLAAIKEMARVAREVRIFPLLDYKGNVADSVGPILLALQTQQYGVEVRDVDYHFQKHSHAMLRLWALGCEVK